MNNYIRLYNKINQIVSERYILLKDKNLNWNSISNKYKNQLKYVNDNTKFVKLINDVLLELKDGHVNFSDITQTSPYYLPFTLNFIQKNLVVTSSGDIPKGAIILKINEKKISDLFALYPSSFPLTAIKTRILEDIYKTLKKETKFEYLYNDCILKKVIKGNSITLDMIKTVNSLNKIPSFSEIQTKKINNIYYLKIFMFIKNVYHSVSKWMVKLPSNHNIIIDLRGCKGGNVSETIKVTSLFLENNINLGKKTSNINGQDIEQPLIINVSPLNIPFKQIIILIDNFTVSSSEFIFLRALSKNKNVILVGEETAGIVHGTNNFIINNTYSLTLTTHKYYDENNTLLPNKGISPNVFVPTSINDDIDTCLETAVGLFNV